MKKFFINKLDKIFIPLKKLMPIKQNLWLFGAWFGEKYADNSRYLYEYIINNHPEIKAFWITKNRQLYDKLISENKPVLYAKSLKGLLSTIQADVIVMTNNYIDINYRFLINKKSFKVQLWHGIPLKKIGLDSNFQLVNNFDYDLIISSSLEVSKKFSSAFNYPLNKIKITGFPRDDYICNKLFKSNKFSILYAPTHRLQGNGNIENYLPSDKELEIINEFCIDSNCIFYIKLHPHDEKKMKNLHIYSNIKLILSTSNYDINMDLLKFDVLLTDYSSILFDFLLLKKPIIFSVFDYKNYVNYDQGLYYSLQELNMGEICYSWSEILTLLKEYRNDFNKYLIKYLPNMEKALNRFFMYKDCKNSYRVFEEIKKYKE